MLETLGGRLVQKFQEKDLLNSIYSIAFFGSSIKTPNYKQIDDVDILTLGKTYSILTKVGNSLTELINDYRKEGTNFYFIGNFVFKEVKRPSPNHTPIHFLFYTPETLEIRERPEIVNGILNQHKLIYGTPLSQIVKSQNERDFRTQIIDFKQLVADNFFNLSEESDIAMRQMRHIAKYALRFATSHFKNQPDRLRSIDWLNSDNPSEIAQKTIEYLEELEKYV